MSDVLALLPHGDHLIATDPVDRAAWLAARRTGIGGSEVAAIAGMGRFCKKVQFHFTHGLFFEVDSAGACFFATDGHALVYDDRTSLRDAHLGRSRRIPPPELRFSVPQQVSPILGVLGMSGGCDAYWGFQSSTVMFRGEGWAVRCKAEIGVSPNFRAVLRDLGEDRVSVIVGAGSLATALRGIRRGEGEYVRVWTQKGTLYLNGPEVLGEAARCSVPLESASGDFDVILKLELLRNIAETAGPGALQVWWHGDAKPLRFEGSIGRYLLMPAIRPADAGGRGR